MILGIGIDLVHVESLAGQLADGASRFSEETFTPQEAAYSRGAVSGEPARHFAARYAAKEAALKALEAACAQVHVRIPSLSLREIEVEPDAVGRPVLRLHGAAASLAERAGADRAWVSLSHEGACAAAMVILERIA